MTYRKLKKKEIVQLEKQGCCAENWNKVEIKGATNLALLRFSRFYGRVQLGGHLRSPPSSHSRQGVFHALLKNVLIGDEVRIENVGELSETEVGRGACIANVDKIAHADGYSFGEGEKISPMLETGGRPFLLWRAWRPDVAEAYLFYLSSAAKKRANQEIEKSLPQLKASQIGEGVSIKGCRELVNINLSAGTMIHNTDIVRRLSTFTTPAAPIEIDGAAFLDRVILLPAVKIGTGCIVKASQLDQGVCLGDQAYVQDSLIWPNSEIFLSEVISSVFGPHAVSHHRSSLHIAGKYSFYNAGSGCHFSNHNYRLGPMHQGVLERGVKMTSGAYLLFPAQIGAFTTVSGIHKGHPRTSEFPFALLYEDKGSSLLVPGYNLFNVGSLRDELKWSKRDRRSNSHYPISTARYNRLSLAHLWLGMDRLHKHGETDFLGQGFRIKKIFHKRYLEDTALLMTMLYSRALKNRPLKEESPRKKSPEPFVDLAGNLVPQSILLASEQTGSPLADLRTRLKKWEKLSDKKAWQNMVTQLLHFDPGLKARSKKELDKAERVYLDKLYRDGRKEFSESMRVSYKSDEEFYEIHGLPAEHPLWADLER